MNLFYFNEEILQRFEKNTCRLEAVVSRLFQRKRSELCTCEVAN